MDDAAKNGKEAWDAWGTVLVRCFAAEPTARPGFGELSGLIGAMLSAQNGQLPAARDVGVISRPPPAAK